MPVDVLGEAAFGPREHRLVGGPWPTAKTGALVVAKCLLDLILRIHHKWPVLGDRFADGPPAPEHYEAHYDLRKARGKRQTMRFISRAGAVFAERGPDDTSQKPPLADNFRKNVLDPLSALTAIRHELRRGNRGSFTVPV